MKVNEVPQDGRILESSGVRDLCYATDENGDYKQVISVGWDAKIVALDFTWESIYQECEEIKKEVLSGDKSPLAYHLHRLVMTPEILSDYSGFSKREIKRWCRAKHFNKLSGEQLSRLASALRISVEQLTSLD
ncbi:MAG: hypothetical protein CVU10_07185 [Bacteroidetes bacterium HGW-Bacteroidetes-5]|jgi:hypothetical protein|nr:MAG: hypothetical protein CVU10_07185 [Bacteroidetes bacterium HGW-Bacteroidetes-5]